MNYLALLPNLAGPDGLIIFLVILLLFGAKKLPELARGLGQAVREFSKAKDDLEREVTRPGVVNEPRLEAPRDTQPHTISAEPASSTTTPVTPAADEANRTTTPVHHA